MMTGSVSNMGTLLGLGQLDEVVEFLLVFLQAEVDNKKKLVKS
jgi:hypothetical protein